MTDLKLLARELRRAAPEVESGAPELDVAAHEAGLLDVAYGTLDSPLGTLLLAVTPVGLVRIAYLDGNEEAVLEELVSRISPRVLSAPRRLDEPRREIIDRYVPEQPRVADRP